MNQLCIVQNCVGDDTGLDRLKSSYWVTYLLMLSKYFICALALLSPGAYSSFSLVDRRSLYGFLCISFFSLTQTGGGYLGLFFLPAAIVRVYLV